MKNNPQTLGSDNAAQLTNRLRELELFTEVIPDGVLIFNTELLIEAVNESAQALLGLPEACVGRLLSETINAPRLNSYLNASSEQEPLEFSSPVVKDATLEARLFQVDANTKVMIVRDITTLNRLLTMRQSFVANVSHELRTPLTVVKGYLETLVDEGTPAELRLSLIGKLKAPVRRMESLVNDLLLLTQLESTPVPPEMDDVDMLALIDNACAEVQGLIGENDSLITDYQTDRIIKGVPSELNSVCTNLISNAIRYSPNGASIEVLWKEGPPGKARLEVRDQGLGIAKEHLDRLTERFYRVDMQNSRSRGGTGLGLAIVKHVLRRHNSELQVHSEPNHGSVFFCDFDCPNPPN